jgi:hypothetical protein
MVRHSGLVWAKVQARLEAKPDKLWSLAEMERTGGEPDVVGHAKSRANAFSSIVPTPGCHIDQCNVRTPVKHQIRCARRSTDGGRPK